MQNIHSPVICDLHKSLFFLGNLHDKCQNLMQNLESRLKTHSPVQRLDILIALREANALEIFKDNMTDLNFSNFPLTTSVIHTLCYLMQLARKVPYLSLANCGIEDTLFETFVTETKGLGIEVGSPFLLYHSYSFFLVDEAR